MEHLLNDYWESQLIWTAMLAISWVLISIMKIESLSTKYIILRNIFLSFPIIFMIKFYHLELPFKLFSNNDEQIMNGKFSVAEAETFDFISLILILFIALLMFKGFAYWKSVRIKKNTTLVKDKHLIETFNSVKKDLGLSRKKITFKKDTFIKSPYCFGFSNYYIVVPEHILNDINQKSLRSVLMHEMNHIKNRDTLFLIFEEIIQLLSLLNPMTFIMQKKINEYREHRCDQDVLETNLVSKKDYASTLLDIKLKTQHGYWPIPVAPLTTQSSNLERRIKSMKKLRKKDSKIKIGFTSMLLITSLIFIACENKAEEKNNDKEVAFGDMSNAQKIEFKKRLEAEKKANKSKMRTKNDATFEFKDGALNKPFGEFSLVEKGENSFVVKDKDGSEHEVHLRKDADGNVSFEAPKKLLKKMKEFGAQARSKNDHFIREMKSDEISKAELHKIEKNEFVKKKNKMLKEKKEKEHNE